MAKLSTLRCCILTYTATQRYHTASHSMCTTHVVSTAEHPAGRGAHESPRAGLARVVDQYSIRYQHQSNSNALRAPKRAENTFGEKSGARRFPPRSLEHVGSVEASTGNIRPIYIPCMYPSEFYNVQQKSHKKGALILILK